uniref:CoA-substrate-specific enzyme activase n=1 Tax=Desulfovibrio desulfuricans (strain ATCC 27774 / DSM 6949 / MB) TaxID=525146 RepID=B8J4J9_DESDA
MFAAGIDVGSVAAKAVIFDTASRSMAGGTVLPTGWNTREAGERALAAVCGQAGVDRADLARIVATGYGRIALPFAHKTVTEITCHARGASWLFPGSGVVLDIGGQDSKAISLDENGGVRDFVMNDKCAAGTGRFLQVLAGILGMPLDDLGKAAVGGSPVPISSMCAVFAETEIVGLLAQGTPPADLAAGVFVSIARRMRGLARRISFTGQCVFTGGMATSPAFCDFLSRELEIPVRVPDEPQLVGALGAALLAAHQLEKKHHA